MAVFVDDMFKAGIIDPVNRWDFNEQDNKLLKIDTRPSDGLAIAFKTDTPAYAEAKAFEEDGRKIC